MITLLTVAVVIEFILLLWITWSLSDKFASIDRSIHQIKNMQCEIECLSDRFQSLRNKHLELAASLKMEWVDNTERTVGYKKVENKKSSN